MSPSLAPPIALSILIALSRDLAGATSYSYAFGQLLALAAYARDRRSGEPFVDRYLEMLTSGGARDLQQLAEMIGFDLADPAFWNLCLDLIDARLREAEELGGRRRQLNSRAPLTNRWPRRLRDDESGSRLQDPERRAIR